jgi:hypothetical protein
MENNMTARAARTISAHADAATIKIIEHIAEDEERSPSQVAAMALRFYSQLPAEARTAFRRIEKLGTEQDMRSLAHEIACRALDAEWKIAHRRLMKEIKPRKIPDDEEAILAEALRLTR